MCYNQDMLVLLGEITSTFQENEENYDLSFRGIPDIASYLDDNGIKGFSSVTKLSLDRQGEIHKELLLDYKWSKTECLMHSPLLSSVMIDCDMRIKGTAPASIRVEEVLPILDQLSPDCIVVTESILSVEPSSSSIAEAITLLPSKPKVIVYSDSVWPHIESLETLKKAVDTLAERVEVCLMSESVESRNAIKIERDHFLDAIR